jgi:hypothetical protein
MTGGIVAAAILLILLALWIGYPLAARRTDIPLTS